MIRESNSAAMLGLVLLLTAFMFGVVVGQIIGWIG